ncbi:hypothetical protein RYA05_03230 [Pseudomonas syringae pv. actinidiae]|nr:hypothetical protein [Pseudomonas syringae pv. actinidiae]
MTSSANVPAEDAVKKILDRYTPTTPCPVEKKNWVMERDVQHPSIGRVKDCYWDSACQEWVIDIVLYSPDGDRIGRSSPAMGGPRSFEPAVPFEYWERIEKPQFPLNRDGTGYRDWRDSVTVIKQPEAESSAS